MLIYRFRDVRRSALCNLPVTDGTISAILGRTRDTDTTIRKSVYCQVLAKARSIGDSHADMHATGCAHPQNLTESQRELIIRNGLGDREPSVRAAASTLLVEWVNAIGLMAEEGDVKEHDRVEQPWDAKVLSMLTLLDLGEGTVAMDALSSLFTSMPAMFNHIQFSGTHRVHGT